MSRVKQSDLKELIAEFAEIAIDNPNSSISLPIGELGFETGDYQIQICFVKDKNAFIPEGGAAIAEYENVTKTMVN